MVALTRQGDVVLDVLSRVHGLNPPPIIDSAHPTSVARHDPASYSHLRPGVLAYELYLL